MENIPKRAVVVGNGYIGAEIAGILNGFGSEVKMLIRTNNFIR